jgi:hypothetical protein
MPSGSEIPQLPLTPSPVQESYSTGQIVVVGGGATLV